MGPTSTLSPTLFDYGVDGIAGFVVIDPEKCFDIVGRNAPGMFSTGIMVDFRKDAVIGINGGTR